MIISILAALAAVTTSGARADSATLKNLSVYVCDIKTDDKPNPPEERTELVLSSSAVGAVQSVWERLPSLEDQRKTTNIKCKLGMEDSD